MDFGLPTALPDIFTAKSLVWGSIRLAPICGVQKYCLSVAGEASSIIAVRLLVS